jgi:NADPH:quinone reductase-like Zn-dependent oxidoreductase
MKKIVIEALGSPEKQARCVDAADPAAPGAGEVSVRILAAPINPADLLQIEGRYGVRPPLPYTPGHEGAGRIEAVGPDVQGLAVGDLVLPGVFGTWCERIVCKAAGVTRLPPDTDPLQAAMLRANPGSAWAMLDAIPALAAGDWVIQNAGNSAVAGFVHRLAARRGVRTIAVVRRAEALAAAKASGATLAVVDDHERGSDDALQAAVAEAVGAFETAAGEPPAPGGQPRIRGALDAIGGRATARLARCLHDGGVVINYGLLSGEDCSIRPHELVFRGVRLEGFWLSSWFRGAGAQRIRTMYDELAELMRSGAISAPIAATYRFERIAEALAHSAQGGRDGKILLVGED